LTGFRVAEDLVFFLCHELNGKTKHHVSHITWEIGNGLRQGGGWGGGWGGVRADSSS
jgi:hypothetical protein